MDILLDNLQHWKMQEIWNPFHKPKLFDFKGIFKFWTHEQQELTSIQMFISFSC